MECFGEVVLAVRAPLDYAPLLPVELDLVELTPRESEENFVSSDGGYVEDNVFLMSMLCGHLGMDLVGDNVEGSSGH